MQNWYISVLRSPKTHPTFIVQTNSDPLQLCEAPIAYQRGGGD